MRMAADWRNDVLSRREYLVYRSLVAGFPIFLIHEAVSSTAIEHPEWDMDERKTRDEWDALDAAKSPHHR